MPNNHDGLSYRLMVREKDRCELYAAWTLMVQVASRNPQPYRGYLVRNGRELSAEDFAVVTGFPTEAFAKALRFFLKPEIGWLEKVDLSGAVVPADGAGAPATPAGGPAAGPQATADGAGSPAAAAGRTEQNRTEQKGTEEEEGVAPPGLSRVQYAAQKALLDSHPGKRADATRAERAEYRKMAAELKQIQQRQAAGRV